MIARERSREEEIFFKPFFGVGIGRETLCWGVVVGWGFVRRVCGSDYVVIDVERNTVCWVNMVPEIERK